jgi:hypothetical protein
MFAPETPSRFHDQLACRAIRSLFDADPPVAAILGAKYGRWHARVQGLAQAYAKGGRKALDAAFSSLIRTDPELITLLAATPPANDAVAEIAPADDLLGADFPPTRFVVADLLPVGLSILAGRPKLGKSWLALQIAIAVATGTPVLGRPTEQGPVLYLALEDSPRRLKERLLRQGAPHGMPLHFGPRWAPFHLGGLHDLEYQMSLGYRLIIIDTFSRAAGGADQMDPAAMNRVLAPLQELAARYDVALLLVDHHRKSARFSPDTDPIDDILGATSKGGVADNAIGLYRRHGEATATLKSSARDFEGEELALRWEPTTCTWHCAGEAATVAKQEQQRDLLDVLAASGRMGFGALLAATGQKRTTLFRRLQQLVAGGTVLREEHTGRVYYRLAPAAADAALPLFAAEETAGTVPMAEPSGMDGTGEIDGTGGMNGTGKIDGTDRMDGTGGTSGIDGICGIGGMDETGGMDRTDGMDGSDGMDGTAGAAGMSGTAVASVSPLASPAAVGRQAAAPLPRTGPHPGHGGGHGQPHKRHRRRRR